MGPTAKCTTSWQEVSNTDLLMDLCDGIYLARVQGNLRAEWELYHEPGQQFGPHTGMSRVRRSTKSERGQARKPRS